MLALIYGSTTKCSYLKTENKLKTLCLMLFEVLYKPKRKRKQNTKRIHSKAVSLTFIKIDVFYYKTCKLLNKYFDNLFIQNKKD